MSKCSVYELYMLVETKRGEKNVMLSKVEAKSYDEAKQKSYHAAGALGYTVLRFIDSKDCQEW